MDIDEKEVEREKERVGNKDTNKVIGKYRERTERNSEVIMKNTFHNFV